MQGKKHESDDIAGWLCDGIIGFTPSFVVPALSPSLAREKASCEAIAM
jgi:hypothetical protein